MNLSAGKSKTERNKTIAAILLGIACLVVLYLAFGRSFFGGNTSTTTVQNSPTPRATSTPNGAAEAQALPSQAEQNFEYQTVPINYRPGNFSAPGAGRNIFAFYEPPVPTPYVPTPIPQMPVMTPIPPTPFPVQIAYVMPQTIYAGSKGFRIEVNGDKFTPDMRIYFSQNELPTTFVSGQRLVAEVPANFISGEGPRQIMVQSLDGTKYSNQTLLSVQAPPKPPFQFIGLIARKRSNNDTAYFLPNGEDIPITARLNDLVGGRFRVASISVEETILEDVNLGFRHKLPLNRLDPSADASVRPASGRPGANTTYRPYSPPANYNYPQPDEPNPAGIPANVPRYQPPNPPANQKIIQKSDVDDDEDGGY